MLPKLKKNVYREIYTYLRAGKQGEVVERLYERLFLLNKYIESYQENIIAPAETMGGDMGIMAVKQKKRRVGFV